MKYEQTKKILESKQVAALVGSDTICTPFALIDEILDKLPKEIWSNPDVKLLDPACGRGAFLVAAKYRFLSAGLDEKHVVENMLFGVDLDPRDVGVAKVALDPENKYNVENVVCDDSLKRDWMGMKFDVVVGNPPYQHAVVPGGKNTVSTPLWYSFVDLSFNQVIDGGIVAYVTPSTWVQTNNKINKILSTFNVLNAKVFSKSPFGYQVGTTASFWLCKKEKASGQFVVQFDEVEVDISTVSLVPSKADNIALRMGIFAKTLNSDEKKLNSVITDTHYANQKKDIVRATKSATHKYPVYNTHTTPNMWSKYKDGLHGAPKVILPYTGSVSRLVYDTERSVTERAVAFLVKNEEEGVVLMSVLSSTLYRFLLASCRTNATLPRAVFKALPNVDLSRSWTDQELYEHFNLTSEEIKLIEDTVK